MQGNNLRLFTMTAVKTHFAVVRERSLVFSFLFTTYIGYYKYIRVLVVIMVTISGSVEETLGEPWVRSIEPPFHEDSVHALSLADDADPVEVLKRIQQSFGHRCAKSKNSTRLPGATINQTEWSAQHEPDFRKWNVNLSEGAARLRTLHKD